MITLDTEHFLRMYFKKRIIKDAENFKNCHIFNKKEKHIIHEKIQDTVHWHQIPRKSSKYHGLNSAITIITIIIIIIIINILRFKANWFEVVL